MEVNDLFGLPAHPLLVHAAVVLLSSVGATWTIIDVGHSGAKAAGDDTPAASDGA